MYTVRIALSMSLNEEYKKWDALEFPEHFMVQEESMKDMRQRLHKEIDDLLEMYVIGNPDTVLIEKGMDILNDT